MIAKITGALLKLASAGTMPPLNEALTIVSPSTVDPVTAAVSALKLNRLAFSTQRKQRRSQSHHRWHVACSLEWHE